MPFELKLISLPTGSEVLEILILWVLFYYLLLLLRGTRGAQVMMGLILCIVFMLAVTHFLNLYTLNWIFKQFSVYLVVGFIIIFQPEIRRALAELGRQNVFAQGPNTRSVVEPIAQAVAQLSENKIGALIALEREIGIRSIVETGVRIDSEASPELLASIFYPHTPLHDGGVVITGNRIMAAGCVFPLSQRAEISRTLGTRHRAAIGITEETDAVVIVVSEETGSISLAYRGRLSRGLDEDRLQRLLLSILGRSATGRTKGEAPGRPLMAPDEEGAA